MIAIVVEGQSDVEMARAIAEYAGHDVAKVVVKRGKGKLDPDIPKYNRAARQMPWVVFRDSDGECPVVLRGRLLDKVEVLSDRFLLRIVPSMSEAWLIADKVNFASYFSLSQGKLPADPDNLAHAKNAVLNLCSRSRSREIKDAMVQRGNRTGPLYVTTINDFAASVWDVEAAAKRSPSLMRTVERLSAIRVT